MIISQLSTIGDKTFINASMISKLLSNLPEGFDNFITASESASTTERTLPNLKLRLLKEESKLKRRISTEISSETHAFISYRPYPNSKSQFHSTQRGGSSRGVFVNTSTSRRGYQPTGRGYQNFSSGRGHQYSSNTGRGLSTSTHGESVPSFSSYRGHDINYMKQHTRCNSCGEFGHWWQECPRIFSNPSRVSPDTQQRNSHFTRAHHVDIQIPDTSEFTETNSHGHMVHLEEPPDTSESENFQDSFDELRLEDTAYFQEPYFDDQRSTPYTSEFISKAYMTSFSLQSTKLLDVSIADSDANMHMSHNFEWFHNYTPLPPDQKWPITTVAGHQTFVAGTGMIRLLVQFPDHTEIISLENVLHVPGLQCNLFSTTLMAKKHGMEFIGKQSTCEFVKHGKVYLTGHLHDDMY